MSNVRTLASGVGAAIGSAYIPSTDRLVFAEFYGSIGAVDLTAPRLYKVLGTGYTNPEDIAVAADGVTAYLTERSGFLLRIKLNATPPLNRDTAELVSQGLTAPHQIALSADGNRAWVVEFAPAGRLWRFDLTKGPNDPTHRQELAGGLTLAIGLLVTADEQRAYFSEQGTNAIRRIDLTNPSAPPQLVCDQLPAVFLLRWADATQSRILVPIRDPANRVYLIDLTANPATKTVVFDQVPWRPSSVAVLPQGRLAVCSDRVVAEYDLASTVGLGGGGAMYRPAISPHNPDLMFVQCDMGGVYRSINRGQTWRLLDGREMTASLTPLDPMNCPVTFHPSNARIIYAAANYRGIRHSDDQGDTWSTDLADPAGNLNVTALALDPASGALRFYGRATGDPSTSGVWRPGDTSPMLQGGSVADFVVNSVTGTFFAALRGPIATGTPRVFRLDAGATTWQPLPTQNLPAGTEIRSFAGGTGTANATVLYVTVRSDPATATSQGGVYRFDTGSPTAVWERRMGQGINEKAPATPDPNAFCPTAAQYDWLGVGATNPDIVYVTVCGTTAAPSVKDGNVYLHSGVFGSTDGGVTWVHIYHYANPQAGQQAPEFNLTGGWIDWDKSWGSGGPARVRAENDDFAGGFGICPTQPNIAVLCNKMALYITDNGLGTTAGSTTWRQVYTRQAPGQGLPAKQQAWQSNGLEVTTAWQYHVHPAEPLRHFICYTDIGLARSQDGGSTWRYSPPRRRRPHLGVQPVRDYNTVYQLAFDTSVPLRVWAACSDQHDIPYDDWLAVRNGGGVARSDDGGADWHDFSGNLPTTVFANQAPPPVTSILVNQATKRVLAAVYGHGVFVSDDASAKAPTDPPPTWQQLPTTGMTGDNRNMYRLTLHDSGDLFCSVTAKREWTPNPSDPRRGTYGRFLKTADGGLWRLPSGSSTWNRVTPAATDAVHPPTNPLNMWWLFDYAVHPENPQIVYVCTGTVPRGLRGTGDPNAVVSGGVFRTLNGGQTWEPVLLLEPPSGPDPSTGAVLPRRYRDFVIGFAPAFDLADPTRSTLYVTTRTHGTWMTRNALDPGVKPRWEERVEVPFVSTQRLVLPPDPTTRYTTTFGAGVWRQSANAHAEV